MQCCQSRVIRACVTLVGVESSYLAVDVIKWNNSSNKSENVCTCLDLSSNCMCMGGGMLSGWCESPFIATKQVMMNEYVVVTHLCPPDLMVIWSNRLQTTPPAFTDNHHKRWNGRQVFFLVLIVSWGVFTALLNECSRTRCMTHTHTHTESELCRRLFTVVLWMKVSSLSGCAVIQTGAKFFSFWPPLPTSLILESGTETALLLSNDSSKIPFFEDICYL